MRWGVGCRRGGGSPGHPSSSSVLRTPRHPPRALEGSQGRTTRREIAPAWSKAIANLLLWLARPPAQGVTGVQASGATSGTPPPGPSPASCSWPHRRWDRSGRHIPSRRYSTRGFPSPAPAGSVQPGSTPSRRWASTRGCEGWAPEAFQIPQRRQGAARLRNPWHAARAGQQGAAGRLPEPGGSESVPAAGWFGRRGPRGVSDTRRRHG